MSMVMALRCCHALLSHSRCALTIASVALTQLTHALDEYWLLDERSSVRDEWNDEIQTHRSSAA